MKEIVYNKCFLKEKDITKIVQRAKVLLINQDKIILGNENDVYQFPGGHLEENETYEECLKREIKEETGIYIDNDEISSPFMSITSFHKDWPKEGENQKTKIIYYIVKTNKEPDLKNTSYTEHEKECNYKLEKIALKKVIDFLNDNLSKNEKNKVIIPDMINVLKEYLNMDLK